MLGTLAKWLRFCGFDTAYATQQMTDGELLIYAQKESFMILTGDKELAFRAQKRSIPIIHIQSKKLDDQLIHVIRETKMRIDKKIMFTRCAECNTILQKINKGDIKQKVPLRVYEQQELFYSCDTCKRIYWMGTHTHQINKKLQEIRDNFNK
jgi:uncharacterized protein with PIN domain